MTTAGTRAVVNTSKGKIDNALKKSRWVWRPKRNYMDHESKEKGYFILKNLSNPEICLQDHAVMDSGYSSHMTSNKAYLSDYEGYNRGFVAFGSDPKGDKISGKGKIRTSTLDFDDVYFVDELKFNIFSVSQMCDKKNSVLFTDIECLILSPRFKLLDENQVVLRAPRQNDVYSLDLKNIVPSGADLVSKAFRVYNKRTKRVEENMHIDFLKDQPNMAGIGPDWMFDLDFLTNTMNYIPVVLKIRLKWMQIHKNNIVAVPLKKIKEPTQEFILHPLQPHEAKDLEDVTEKEEQHMLTEADQALKDDLERMIA
ncbi:hypothetical protein Tco_1329819 [Tanacetum coccineum]